MSSAHFPAKYAHAINTLGETICLGCGTHFRATEPKGQPQVYCTHSCGTMSVRRQRRLTRKDVQEIIAAM